MRLISRLPVQEPFAELIDWRVRELARLGVEIALGLEADADECARRAPDVVVVATGADPTALAGSLPAADVLAGASPGDGPVVVLDFEGHRKGARRRRDARGRRPGGHARRARPVGAQRAHLLDGRDARPAAPGRLGVRLVEGHRLLAVEDGAVHLERTYDGTPLALETRAVVHASPHTPADGLVRELRASGDPGSSRRRCTRAASRRGRDRRRLSAALAL